MNVNNNYPMHVGIVVTSAAQLASVYALLGGVALAAIAERPAPQPEFAQTAEPSDTYNEYAERTAEPTGGDASGEVDAHGHPWSADLNASTKGKTKDGLWRMKVGVSRPEPLPGFPLQASASQSGAVASPTGTSATGGGTEAGASASGAAASSPAATTDEDDEFASFRAAAAKSDATDAVAAAAVPARKWTDADLGALCNQAAVKLGDPNPVKEIIATFTPEGQVAHSRNIPEDQREAFAKAVEAKAGIEFAG